MRFYKLFCYMYMYNASNYVHHKYISQLLTKYYWYKKKLQKQIWATFCLQVAG